MIAVLALALTWILWVESSTTDRVVPTFPIQSSAWSIEDTAASRGACAALIDDRIEIARRVPPWLSHQTLGADWILHESERLTWSRRFLCLPAGVRPHVQSWPVDRER